MVDGSCLPLALPRQASLRQSRRARISARWGTRTGANPRRFGVYESNVEIVILLHANPQYARVQHSDGGETTVPLRRLSVPTESNISYLISQNDDDNATVSENVQKDQKQESMVPNDTSQQFGIP